MSHRAEIKTEFRDLDALRAAIDALGLTLTGQGDVRIYGYGKVSAEYTVALPGRYDIGFNRAADGTYTMVCDGEVMYPHDNGRNTDARQALGPTGSRLYQEYLAAAAGMQARREAFSETREMQDDGSLVLIYRR